MNKILQQLLYWGMWLIIPLIWEILSGIISTIVVLILRLTKKPNTLTSYPRVTIIVPVYNSEKTLFKCLESITDQTYPIKSIEVFLIDNGSKDKSYKVFETFQQENPRLKLWWYTSEQGKSKALNKGIFASSGRYIINIDSDGYLDKNAIKNVVAKFESDPKIMCITGVIYTDLERIRQTKNPFLKALQNCEFFEYTESFFIDRSFQSLFNNIYTLAGAFSCFKREAILKTGMYNSETIGEDTHMTFQIRTATKGKVALCENAFLFVDPVESLDKLYVQRQRWQRAEIEVASLYKDLHMGGIFKFFIKPPMRRLVSDHTLVFPRLIWYFAIIFLYFANYPIELIIGSNVLLYIAYVLLSFAYNFVARLFLSEHEQIKKYLESHWYICFIMPFYRFIIYWARLAGIINSITTETKWSANTLNEEINIIKSEIKTEKHKLTFIDRINKMLNKSE